MKYFCSNDGHNVSEDINSPGDFIETLSILSPGDIVYLYPGEYFFNKTININCDNIKITNYTKSVTYNKNLVIFNFKDIPYICSDYDRNLTSYYSDNGNGLNVKCNYCEISNIIIKCAAFRGLENFGNFNVFENIETCYNCDCGHSQHGINNIIINCYSHHNFDYRFIKSGKIKYGYNSDGFADKLHNGNGNIFINCTSEYNGDDGFDFFQRETPENFPTLLKYCISLNNGLKLLDMSLNERLIEDDEYFNKYDIKNYPNYGNGNGFKLGGVHSVNDVNYINNHNINLINCIALSNKQYGFSQNHNRGIIKLENCQACNNDINYSFIDDKTHIYIKNCFSLPQRNNKIDKNNIIENIVSFGNLITYKDTRNL